MTVAWPDRLFDTFKRADIRQVGYVMWAPDGRLGIIEPVQQEDCVGVTLCYANQLYLLAADGSGRIERFPATTGIEDLQWRPPDGRTMLFRALVDGKFGLRVWTGSFPVRISRAYLNLGAKVGVAGPPCVGTAPCHL